MGWLEFISAIVGHLVWPIAVLAVIGILRKPITDLFEKLVEFKGGGFEATFAAELDSVRESVGGRAAGDTVDFAEREEGVVEFEFPFDGKTGKILDSGEPRSSGVAQILSAWSGLEGRISDIYSGVHPEDKSRRRSLVFMLARLLSEGYISEASKDSITGLSHMRNLAVHAPGGEISPEKVSDYLALVGASTFALDQQQREREKKGHGKVQ